jgi:hypothetical protein
MFGAGFCHFFIYALHFWIKHYINFQNFIKFVSRHPPLLLFTATFTSTNFLTGNYFFIRPVLSYLAVATASWQHCV